MAAQQVLSLTRYQLTPHIDVFSGFTNGNVLAVRSDSGTLLVDAQSAAAPEAMPSSGFADSTVLPFGAEEVRVYHAPNAHADGDAIIWLPRSNIIHLGDIFELAAPPFIDWWVAGSATGMIAAIDRILPLINERTRVVPNETVLCRPVAR
ncbi:MAG: hypothetical protein ACT4P6_21305 [Gemmatimonadaceae bacterium]